MQVHKYVSMQVLKWASMWACNYTQVCMDLRMQLDANMQYAWMQVTHLNISIKWSLILTKFSENLFVMFMNGTRKMLATYCRIANHHLEDKLSQIFMKFCIIYNWVSRRHQQSMKPMCEHSQTTHINLHAWVYIFGYSFLTVHNLETEGWAETRFWLVKTETRPK